MRRFRVTADIWCYEPGEGSVPHQYDEIIEARDWDDAKKQAEALVYARRWRWGAWYYSNGGWEKNRTAQDYQYCWLRVDPAD